MPAIFLTPAGAETARLTVTLAGSEWFEFAAALAPTMNLRFEPDGRRFPLKGSVSIRRGVDHTKSGERIVDSFRYIESCTAGDTGEHVEERFGVTLFMPEAAFDRLTERAHWGLPELVLFFDASSEVITFEPGGNVQDLRFRLNPRPWEEIASATLTQSPLASASQERPVVAMSESAVMGSRASA
jgi:hypothetical protein